MTTESPGTTAAWAALGADSRLLDRVTFDHPSSELSGRLPVGELARATVAVCALAAAELSAVRAGRRAVPPVRVAEAAVATAFRSDRFVTLDGRAWDTFAPLSRFWRAADGWVRTHANYPHHRARLVAALGLPPDAGADAVAEAVGGRTAADVEAVVYAAGGLAVAVRSADEWAAHEQGALVAKQPLLTLDRVGGGGEPVRDAGRDALPCAGLRVLDLTRVLAGPIATRTLALLGADVLRVDAPGLPESQETHNDTGLGKRSTLLDLARGADRRVFDELLSGADVVVTGYRPGALDRFGLDAGALVERRPGLVVAELSAWGRYGPWRERRGFDSLVQAATGIALSEAAQVRETGRVREAAQARDTAQVPAAAPEGASAKPGALAAQALDHGTGYLLAAAVLRALTERHREGGGSRVARLALTQTAHWLTHGLTHGPAEGSADGSADEAAGSAPYDPERWLVERDTPLGRLRYARSPVTYAGGPADWARPPGLWGTDPARWVTD
ncbi:CoA transferase [Streptomyces sp. NPDC047928]|uniref:CoA transferase n=1 Tax=unclassified Streptomyces TaxID=2593676 RepID=UPI0037234C58